MPAGEGVVIRLLISAVLYLVANAIGLLVADALLDDVSIDGAAFVIAVVVFTVVEVVMQPLITQIAMRHSRALLGSSALIATLVGLVVTTLVSDGLSIQGALTWVLATVIVWAAGLVAGLILPAIFLKKAVTNGREG
jgi:putative membrane protein